MALDCMVNKNFKHEDNWKSTGMSRHMVLMLKTTKELLQQ